MTFHDFWSTNSMTFHDLRFKMRTRKRRSGNKKLFYYLHIWRQNKFCHSMTFHDLFIKISIFHDFQGLEKDYAKFHDFPCFPWPVWTLTSYNDYIYKQLGSTKTKQASHILQYNTHLHQHTWSIHNLYMYMSKMCIQNIANIFAGFLIHVCWVLREIHKN